MGPLRRMRSAGYRSATISDWALNPREAILKKEVRRLLDEAIQALPPTYRAVVVLRDIENLTYEEFQAVTGLAAGTVKSRLHRARLALAQRVRELRQSGTMSESED